MFSFGLTSWSRFLRSYTMRAAEFIVISRCLLYKRGPYKLTDKARDFHGHWKSIPYFLGISFKLSKPPYATGKSLRKLTKIEMAFYQKRKASFSSSLLSKFKKFNKILEKTEDLLQKREGFLSQGIMWWKEAVSCQETLQFKSNLRKMKDKNFFRRISTACCCVLLDL